MFLCALFFFYHQDDLEGFNNCYYHLLGDNWYDLPNSTETQTLNLQDTEDAKNSRHKNVHIVPGIKLMTVRVLIIV